jgi:hypothetical protein
MQGALDMGGRWSAYSTLVIADTVVSAQVGRTETRLVSMQWLSTKRTNEDIVKRRYLPRHLLSVDQGHGDEVELTRWMPRPEDGGKSI